MSKKGLDSFKPFLKPEKQKTSKPVTSKKQTEKPKVEIVRLNKYIADAGVCSRREADKLIEAGEIRVNGKVVKELGLKVKSTDRIEHKGKLLTRGELVYVLLNKPKDFITTTKDPEGRRTVMDLVKKSTDERIYPVGRLDRNTTGLLLFTNDGELAEKLSHPKKNIKKIYQVEIDTPIKEEDFITIKEGFELEDGAVKVDKISILSPEANLFGIELHIGRNRIVRRIFEHFGYDVIKLDRVMYAGLDKKKLSRGKWRYLTPKEVIRLKYMTK